MLPNSSISDPEFFGKDAFVPFLGQVEDVNDPKQSGRVKVRCMGWHPKDKNDLPTEDLPWARVGMPTTHAQIGRVGGKHGLLPGSWVMGFFMDGQDVQNPFVLTTFNATSNATEETNTNLPSGKEGKLDDNDRAFSKQMGAQGIENKAHRIKDEAGAGSSNKPSSIVDKSGDNNTHNAINKCSGDDKSHQNIADYNNTEAENTVDNPTSFNYDQALPDSKCGASSHALERIQIILKELFPNSNSRFSFNDSVYSSVSGNRIDVNAIMNFASILICDILKDPIENLRGLINDTLLRPTRSTAILSATTREYSTVKIADLASKTSIDIANKVFTEIIENLCMIISDLLKAINNQEEPGGGASASTDISDASAICVSETIVKNILTLVTSAAVAALGSSLAGGLQTSQNLQDSLDSGSLGGLGDILESVTPGLEGLDQISDIISFITELKFTTNPLLFNTLSLITLDIFNRDGCNEEGSFATSIGALQSLGFGNGGFGGLSSESNDGFATTKVCDEALGGLLFEGSLSSLPSVGCRADVITVSVPSSESEAAQNFINGIANSVVIRNPGCEFFTPSNGNQILYDISSLF